MAGTDLGPWLDRYVAGDDPPPLPEDSSAFAYGGDLDPDGDGAGSATDPCRLAPVRRRAADAAARRCSVGDGLRYVYRSPSPIPSASPHSGHW